MYDPEKIADSIKNRAKERNIQMKDMLLDLGLNKNTLSTMYNGSMLKGDSLARIADYLDCSVDYLLGRSTADRTHRKRIFSGGNVGETVCRPAAPHFQSPGAGNHRDPSGRMTGNHG